MRQEDTRRGRQHRGSGRAPPASFGYRCALPSAGRLRGAPAGGEGEEPPPPRATADAEPEPVAEADGKAAPRWGSWTEIVRRDAAAPARAAAAAAADDVAAWLGELTGEAAAGLKLLPDPTRRRPCTVPLTAVAAATGEADEAASEGGLSPWEGRGLLLFALRYFAPPTAGAVAGPVAAAVTCIGSSDAMLSRGEASSGAPASTAA
jgi:hypothetical protein